MAKREKSLSDSEIEIENIELYPPKIAKLRADVVLKRMFNTPPAPHTPKQKKKRAKRAKSPA